MIDHPSCPEKGPYRRMSIRLPSHPILFVGRRSLRLVDICAIIFSFTLAYRLFFSSERFAPVSHHALSATEPHSLISSKIWQIVLPHSQSPNDTTIDPEALVDTPSWLAMNPDYDYKLMAQKDADRFVNKNFAKHPEVLQTYHGLKNPGLKSDLLRYLVLSLEGGVYTDIDTIALKPIDSWVPDNMVDRVRLIVGIEFDQADGGTWADIPHALQLCQWTIAAAPGHRVFTKMTQRAITSLDQLVTKYNTTLAELAPVSIEVMNSTGPAAWTDVLWEQIRLAEPSLTSLRNLSFMTEPTLYGDILVLPIDGFGMGQRHSYSTNNGTIPDAALVKHNFRGSWRHG